MSWLVGLIVNSVLDWLRRFAESVIYRFKKEQEGHKSQVDQAAQDTEELKKVNESTPPDEVDKALDDALKHL